MTHSKQMISTMLMLMGVGALSAQTVSQQQALDRAQQFLQQHQSGARRAHGAIRFDLKLAHVAQTGNEVYYYAFNQGDEAGFVIVGGDECADRILGYSEHGSFDLNNAPENFRWWMSQYEQQIHQSIQQGKGTQAQAMNAASASPRQDVPSMIQTKWGQDKPYNLAIPRIGEGYDNFVTGCVATAMSQVMNYYQWPAGTGTGSNSYQISYSNLPNPITFGANFGATHYDWDNMLNTYSRGQYNETQAEAVATLMYHTGVSVNMNYNNRTSSASNSKIANALYTYFGYDKSAYLAQRNYYTDAEWSDLLFAELMAGRPLMYGGMDKDGNGGHLFICHGYSAVDDLYAINWGWEGMCDGYFSIMGETGLRPGNSGTGGAGANASYTLDQNVVVNVMPDQGGDYELVVLNAPVAQGFKPLFTDYYENEKASATFNLSGNSESMYYSYYPWNMSAVTKTIETCVMFRDIISGNVHYSAMKGGPSTVEPTHLVNHLVRIDPTDFIYNGTYEVYLAVREQGKSEWQRLRVETSVPVPTITVTGGQDPPANDVTFSISSLSVEENCTIQISHDEYYTGQITYSASPSDVVSIDANGLVTGLKCGTARITVKGEKSLHFNATTTTFDVEVIPYVMRDVEFSINDTEVLVGKSLQITYFAPRYTGTVVYSSSDNTIATVDATGKITGQGEGQATITAQVAGDQYFNPSTTTFDIKVDKAGITLLSYTYDNDGYMLYDQVAVTATFRNNTEHTMNVDLSCDFKLTGVGLLPCELTHKNWAPGEDFTITFDTQGYEDKIESIAKKKKECYFTLYAGNEVLAGPVPFYPCLYLTVDQTLPASGWNTLCLPFNATLPVGLTAYSVEEVMGNGVVKTEAQSIRMNTPYLINGAAGTYSFTGPDTREGTSFVSGLLVGNTSASATAPQGSYLLQQQGDLGVGFYRVESATSLPQYGAYLSLDDVEADFIGLEPSAAIETVENDQNGTVEWYDLQGCKTNDHTHGLKVGNGRLIFVR